jgi:hypothetical protein
VVVMKGRPVLPITDGLRFVDEYDPAVHAYHWMHWRLPNLDWNLYLSSTDDDLERMARHREQVLESIRREGGAGAGLSADVLNLIR